MRSGDTVLSINGEPHTVVYVGITNCTTRRAVPPKGLRIFGYSRLQMVDEGLWQEVQK